MGKISLRVKIAVFCRELGDSDLAKLARGNGMGAVYRDAEQSVRSGSVGPETERCLDLLDEMVAQAEGRGLYPATRHVYSPLPGSEPTTGAQWWACPRGICAGRGRVRPGVQLPVCAASGEPLVAGPLPE